MAVNTFSLHQTNTQTPMHNYPLQASTKHTYITYLTPKFPELNICVTQVIQLYERRISQT